MAKVNVEQGTPDLVTHEGARAKRIDVKAQLRRSVMACMLWENEFYEDGQEIGARIAELVGLVKPEAVAALAVEAREQMHLRHVPLWLCVALAKHGRGKLVAETIASIVRRADELGELVALYWKDGKRPLSAQMKKGLALAFGKFNEYQLAKYDRDGAVRLRDVMFLVHPKPSDEAQAVLWKKLAAGELATPDTWEVALSKGDVKKDAWERLLTEGKLGYLALLRNLRNMEKASVDMAMVRDAITTRKGAAQVLPFRYIAAARACPQMEPALDKALIASIEGLPSLTGHTIVLVDVSGSMGQTLSAKSDMTRMDAAAALGVMVKGLVRVFTFSDKLVEVPPRSGMAGIDAIKASQGHSSTHLGAAIGEINKLDYDRLIVITDEQSHDDVPGTKGGHAYMVNVASAKNGVGYGRWTHIDGFSEAILHYIAAAEGMGGCRE